MTRKTEPSPAPSAPRRRWTVPSARRLATSDAENAPGVGPDFETVNS